MRWMSLALKLLRSAVIICPKALLSDTVCTSFSASLRMWAMRLLPCLVIVISLRRCWRRVWPPLCSMLSRQSVSEAAGLIRCGTPSITVRLGNLARKLGRCSRKVVILSLSGLCPVSAGLSTLVGPS